MGRYLAIGITTNLALQKKEAEDAFESLQNAIKYVEDNYAPLDIYDRTENEEYVMFKIKNKLLETELIDFLGDFYAARMPFICIRDEGWHRAYLDLGGIDLSLDGKILMECYNGLFKFFTSLVQEKFNKYSLSKTLRVTITG